jgi:hypothetical protein
MDNVTWAKVHAPLFIPGVGNLKETLPPDNKTLPEFRMSLRDDGSLMLSWKAGTQTKRFVIGAASVLSAMLEPVAAKQTKENDK